MQCLVEWGKGGLRIRREQAQPRHAAEDRTGRDPKFTEAARRHKRDDQCMKEQGAVGEPNRARGSNGGREAPVYIVGRRRRITIKAGEAGVNIQHSFALP